MVYKKYIYKNGRKYGPYIYHSKRIDGKVVSEYRGPTAQSFNYKNYLFLFLGVVLFLTLMYGFVHYKNLTGRAIFGLNANYAEGQPLDGVLSLSMKEGEFLPSDTKVVIKNNNEEYEYNLQELISDEVAQGEFYVEGGSISGYGEGYGIEGEKEIPQIVYFTLEINKEEILENEETEGTSEETETNGKSTESGTEETSEGINEETETPLEEQTPDENTEIVNEPTEEPTESGTEETSNEQQDQTQPNEINSGKEKESKEEKSAEKETKSEEKSESKSSNENSESSSSSESSNSESSSSSESSSPITGAFIKNIGRFFSNMFLSITGRVSSNELSENEGEINGEVAINSPFEYSLNEGYTANVKKNSVQIKEAKQNGEVEFRNVDESNIKLEISDGKAIVTTDYSKKEKGFGEDYLGDGGKILTIDLSQLNLVLKKGSLKIDLVYDDEEIISLKATLKEGEIIVEEEKDILSNETLEKEIIEKTIVSLTEEEKNVLIMEFGNDTSVETTAIERSGGVEVKFKLGNKFATRFYDLDIDDEKLEEWIQIDIINWLKDLAQELLKEDIKYEKVENLNRIFNLNNFSISVNVNASEEIEVETNDEVIIENPEIEEENFTQEITEEVSTEINLSE